MTGHDTGRPGRSAHQEAYALLPWYVNGTLEGHERSAVEAHLPTCRPCREEVARCRDLAGGVRTSGEAPWTPSPQRLTRLLSRIDAAEARPAWVGRWRGYLRDRWRFTPPFVRGVLAAQGALLLLLASLLGWQAATAPAAPYQTLADGGSPVSQGRSRLRVVFADEATAQDMRQILSTVSGTIVGGPSPVGAYTVEVTPTADAPEPMGLVLSAMRAHPKVRLAEPVLVR